MLCYYTTGPLWCPCQFLVKLNWKTQKLIQVWPFLVKRKLTDAYIDIVTTSLLDENSTTATKKCALCHPLKKYKITSLMQKIAWAPRKLSMEPPYATRISPIISSGPPVSATQVKKSPRDVKILTYVSCFPLFISLSLTCARCKHSTGVIIV